MGSDPIRILIVDDDEDVLIRLERLLEGEGYNTATAWSGKEALELSGKAKFDLLLVDEYLGDVETAKLLGGTAPPSTPSLPLRHAFARQRKTPCSCEPPPQRLQVGASRRDCENSQLPCRLGGIGLWEPIGRNERRTSSTDGIRTGLGDRDESLSSARFDLPR